jgi:ATP-dependent Clp protease protease subunit
MHQPLTGGMSGQASDIMIQANEIQRLKDRLLDILSDATGQSREAIERDADRDFYLDAQKAKEYGLIDQVLEPRAAVQAAKVAQVTSGARVVGALPDGEKVARN